MSLSNYTIRPLTPDDYDHVRQLWEGIEGVGLNESDSREAILLFLERNPELSLIVTSPSGEIAGAVLCGHDGRRGYLHHLAVAKGERGNGLGAALVDRCLSSLKNIGILKTNIFLFSDNSSGEAFWKHQGWTKRDDLVVMQRGASGC